MEIRPKYKTDFIRDFNEQEPPEPVYQQPLAEQIKEIKEENILLSVELILSERAYFIKDIIADFAQEVYQ